MKSSWLLPAILALAFNAAADMRFESAGLRLGVGHGHDDVAFVNYEAFGKAALPWRWNWGSQWGLQTGLDLSAGVLQRNSEAGLIVQSGPCFTIGSRSFPVAFEFGSNLTLLSRHHFREKDLGCFVQFNSYAGLQARLGEHVGLGYRIEHMSNAGLGEPNAGLNLHVCALSYRF